MKKPARSFRVNGYEVKEYHNVRRKTGFDNDKVLIFASGTRVYIVMASAISPGQSQESIDKFVKSFKPIM